jgi:hypothetical protein
MNTTYIEYLRSRGVPLFEAGGTYWIMKSGGILVPAQAAPCFVELGEDEAKALLRKSGAYLLYYSSVPCEKETAYWWIICDRFDPGKLSSNTRSKINRGNRACSVKSIEAGWLAENGHECYRSAFGRYNNAESVGEEEYHRNIKEDAKGPFEFWGVFFEDRLAGYTKCIIEEKIATTTVVKYHPAYLKYYSSYALMDNLIRHYVVEMNMTLNNGTRSLLHDTNFQDFLLKLGFRKQFCRLNVTYNSLLKIGIHTLFPARKAIGMLPSRGVISKARSLLFLEELRKTF